MTTGGKPRLLSITKRGNTYLRMLLIHGARAALPSLSKQATALGSWLRGLLSRAHRNVVIVELAAKLARIAWAERKSTRLRPITNAQRVGRLLRETKNRKNPKH